MKFFTSIATLVASISLFAADTEPGIYQISTMNAIHAGVFDAHFPYKEVMKQGTLGVGFVHNLKGEMIAVDGHYYHLHTSGKAEVLDPDETCPFARVVPFNPETHFVMRKEKGFASVTRRIMQQFPSHNTLYAIKIQGIFPRVKLRVLREMKPPYTKLEEAKKDQNEFTLYDVKGTVVGFFTPQFLTSVYDSEFNFSFISSDFKTGGHVLDMSVENVNVLIQPIYKTELILPHHLTFQQAPISGD